MFILWEQRFTKGSGKRHPTYLSCSREYRKERLVDFPGDVMWTRHLPDNLTSFWLLSALLATWRASCHAPPPPPPKLLGAFPVPRIPLGYWAPSCPFDVIFAVSIFPPSISPIHCSTPSCVLGAFLATRHFSDN